MIALPLFLILGLVVGVLFWGLVVWGLVQLLRPTRTDEPQHRPKLQTSSTGPHQGVILVGAAAAVLFLLGTFFYLGFEQRSAPPPPPAHFAHGVAMPGDIAAPADPLAGGFELDGADGQARLSVGEVRSVGIYPSPLLILLVIMAVAWLIWRGRGQVKDYTPTGSVSRWGSGPGLHVPAMLAGGAAVVILVLGLFFLLLAPVAHDERAAQPMQVAMDPPRQAVVAENVIVPKEVEPPPAPRPPVQPPPVAPPRVAQPEALAFVETGVGSARNDAIASAVGKLQVRLAGYARDNLNLDWTPSRAFVEKELRPAIEDKPDLDLGQDNQGRPLGTARQVEVTVQVVAAQHALFERQARADNREGRVVLAAKVVAGLFAAAALLGLVMFAAGNRLFLPLLLIFGIIAGLTTAYCYQAAERPLSGQAQAAPALK